MHHNSADSAAAGLMAGMAAAWLFVAILAIAFFVFFLWMYWRIFEKAGFSGALALLNLIPGVGNLICLIILAFSAWPSQGGGMILQQPQYTPPQPQYIPPQQTGGPPQPLS